MPAATAGDNVGFWVAVWLGHDAINRVPP